MNLEHEYKLIVGFIQYKDIETGYWVLDDGERQYRIVDIPMELKQNGLKIASMSRILDDEVSIYATTLNIEIIEHKILS
jgi:hypothetical protein